MPAIRSRENFGTCWGFASIGACGISLLSDLGITAQEYLELTGSEMNLSERHLAWFASVPIAETEGMTEHDLAQVGEGRGIMNDDGTAGAHFNIGGTMQNASGMFASGIGPVSEEVVPYRANDGSGSTAKDQAVDESLRFNYEWELKDSSILPTPAGLDAESRYVYNPTAAEMIKQELPAGRGESFIGLNGEWTDWLDFTDGVKAGADRVGKFVSFDNLSMKLYLYKMADIETVCARRISSVGRIDYFNVFRTFLCEDRKRRISGQTTDLRISLLLKIDSLDITSYEKVNCQAWGSLCVIFGSVSVLLRYADLDVWAICVINRLMILLFRHNAFSGSRYTIENGYTSGLLGILHICVANVFARKFELNIAPSRIPLFLLIQLTSIIGKSTSARPLTAS